MLLLEDHTIKLRALETEDIDILYEWENNTEIWNVSNTITPFSKYLLKQYIESSHISIFETGQQKFIIQHKAENRPIGAVDLFDFDFFHKRAGVGILINNTTDRRQGFAEAALKLLMDYSFQFLQLHQLYCNIGSTNSGSMQLFKKMGFEISGCKKDWNNTPHGWDDEILLQKIYNNKTT